MKGNEVYRPEYQKLVTLSLASFTTHDNSQNTTLTYRIPIAKHVRDKLAIASNCDAFSNGMIAFNFSMIARTRNVV